MTQVEENTQQDHKKAQSAQGKGVRSSKQGHVPLARFQPDSWEDDQMDEGLRQRVQQAQICPYCGFDCGLYCEAEHLGVRHW